MWRKTRSKTSDPECTGVDPNRNWEFKWGVSGSSHDPCSDTYMGPRPFSEVELINIVDYVQTLDPTPILALPIHCDAQLVLTPFGYDYETYPDNVEEIVDLAKRVAEKMTSVNGIPYEEQNSAEMYPASGASDDWFIGRLGTRFSYTVELRNGISGFIEDPKNIIPTGKETWAGFKLMLRKMMKLSQ